MNDFDFRERLDAELGPVRADETARARLRSAVSRPVRHPARWAAPVAVAAAVAGVVALPLTLDRGGDAVPVPPAATSSSSSASPSTSGPTPSATSSLTASVDGATVTLRSSGTESFAGIDWGDGTSTGVVACPARGVSPRATSTPTASTPVAAAPPTHRYARGGTYVVTVTSDPCGSRARTSVRVAVSSTSTTPAEPASGTKLDPSPAVPSFARTAPLRTTTPTPTRAS